MGRHMADLNDYWTTAEQGASSKCIRFFIRSSEDFARVSSCPQMLESV